MPDTIDKNLKCKILIARLEQYISLKDVCAYIGIQVMDLTGISRVKPSAEFKPENERTRPYHLSKIKFFIDNKIDAPIDIDCIVTNGNHHAHPVIIDGRHRYIAAILRRDEKINATFSGNRDLYDYLTGKSNSRP